MKNKKRLLKLLREALIDLNDQDKISPEECRQIEVAFWFGAHVPATVPENVWRLSPHLPGHEPKHE